MADRFQDTTKNNVRNENVTLHAIQKPESTPMDPQRDGEIDPDEEYLDTEGGDLKEDDTSDQSTNYVMMLENVTDYSNSGSDSDEICTTTNSTDDVAKNIYDVGNMADEMARLTRNLSNMADDLSKDVQYSHYPNPSKKDSFESSDGIIGRSGPDDDVNAQVSSKRKVCHGKYDVNNPCDTLGALPSFPNQDKRMGGRSGCCAEPDTDVERAANNRLSRTKCSVRLLKRQYGRLRKEPIAQARDYVGFFYIRSAAPKIRAEVRTSLTVSKLKSVFEGRQVFGVKSDKVTNWNPVARNGDEGVPNIGALKEPAPV